MVRTLAIALEAVGVCAIIGGIVFEMQVQAPIGFVIITGGSVLVAAGGLLYAKIYRGGK
ncbi:unnamed protein product [marine sediment metagenome]|uniref:Uncharacterized protein n=1 Tax=marine sediment metagenome TaxID=412755 RepID=X1S0P5_9ZZZZ